MTFLERYYQNIVTQNLINKFTYKTIKNVPALKKIVLNFGCKSSNFKLLITSLLALELITGKRGKLIQSKNANLLLKIRKGNPVSCKVVLRKQLMHSFLMKLVFEIFPKTKSFEYFPLKKDRKNTVALSQKITHLLVFSEFEKNYYLFNTIPDLQVTFLMNSQKQEELVYLLNAFKIPTKLKR